MRCVALVLGLLAAAALGRPLRSVIVIRHCDRAPEPAWFVAANLSTNPDDYTAKPWPSFPVAPWMCTPRGLEIIKGEGVHFALSQLPGEITLIADNVTRDNDTAHALAAGMEVDFSKITTDGAIFNPSQYGVCAPLTDYETLQAVTQQYEIVPKPPNYEALMNRMQQVLGKGKMPPLTQIRTYCNQTLLGGAEVANEAAENFLLQFGAGMQVAWGELAHNELYELEALHVYADTISYRPLPVVKNWSSNLLAHIIANLTADHTLFSTLGANQAPPDPATVFYVGHDTDLDGMAELMGLEWASPPYALNTTAPGAALRFDLEITGGRELMVTIWFYSTPFDTTNGKLTVTPAKFTTLHAPIFVGSNHMPLAHFTNFANERMDHSCVGM